MFQKAGVTYEELQQVFDDAPTAIACAMRAVLTCSRIQRLSIHSFQLTVDFYSEAALNRAFRS
jgi:hypothetical protein